MIISQNPGVMVLSVLLSNRTRGSTPSSCEPPIELSGTRNWYIARIADWMLCWSTIVCWVLEVRHLTCGWKLVLHLDQHWPICSCRFKMVGHQTFRRQERYQEDLTPLDTHTPTSPLWVSNHAHNFQQMFQTLILQTRSPPHSSDV
jgi:hypothetical protein